ncbi:DUF885 domain-containing protein [Pseudomaricurvus alkylphenolicus]|uniref:DUF885 domain-containing protein n=1 Tax=Pseudomaricurvus alkylphenolicus TaxID=1306991 RepID=UPI00141F6D83|nr:DUF885 domain-containing protein [Pseudomaricurvus alkylphenolicus]NIB41234.1 DUF885 domain-containing protein [Pseudomaricurvus alkylphenolicus]
MKKLTLLASASVLTLLAACQANNSDTADQAAGQAVDAQNQIQSTAKSASAETPSAAFLAFTEEQAKRILREQPTFATSLGVSEDYLGQKFNDRLPDFSVASIERAKAHTDELRQGLAAIDRTSLSGTAATTYDVMQTTLDLAAEFKPYVFGAYFALGVFSPYTVTQLSGPHIDLPRSLQTEHPLTNSDDVEDYFARLEAVYQALADTAQVVTLEADKGLTPPQFALQGAINVITEMTAVEASQHPLVNSMVQRLKSVESITEEQRQHYAERATKLVAEKVYPGYAALKQALEQAAEKAQGDAGIWALENGTRLYELALQNYGAAGKTAEQVHQLGLDEVARIQAEMDEILKGQGYTEGGIIERYIALTEDPKHLYPNTDSGRQQLLDDLNKQMDEVTGLLPKILVTLPKAPVEVRRIAEYEQDSAPGGYYTGPSLDGSRPGIYWINLKDTGDWPAFTLPTLTYHEASPGHHLQVTIAQEIEDMPMIRNMLWFSQYGEGWALYAERLAKELGLYESDPLGDLGRLQSELFRAARLVVDTGLHHKRWTREQAIEWMYSNTGESKAAVTREIERYSVWPGQATSYKLGQIRLFELRDMAEQALGEEFDLREFNDQILIKGAVPLPVLEANIRGWIEEKKRG